VAARGARSGWPLAVLATLVAAVVRGVLPRGEPAWLPPSALCAALFVVALLAAIALRREPDDAPLARDPAAYLLVAALALLMGTLLGHDYRITSDGVDHYVYLRSLWVDHDLDLANDYALVSPRGGPVDVPTPLGRTGDIHPVGPALVWSPLFLVADVLTRLSGRAPDGWNPLYKNAVAIASLLYGWLGLVFLYLTTRPRAGRGPALLAALGIGFGSFLYWYLAWAPTMAHAPAFGAAALAVWLWLRPGPEGARRAGALGAVCGLSALLKWANGLLILLPLSDAARRALRPGERGAALRDAALAGGAALVVFAPQMLVWKLLYGSFLTIPLGPSYVANAPAWSGVLFSPRHGLFSWSPLLYFGLAGLLLLARREPWRALVSLVFIAALTRVNAGVHDWWGGAAFGARRFDAALPFLGIGLALALAALLRLVARRPLVAPAALVAAFLAWNLGLAQLYRLGTWDYSEPVSFEEMGRGFVSLVDRSLGSPFSLPASLLTWAETGRRPADWESLYEERLHGSWSVRMGTDARMFLDDGWSALSDVGGTPARRLAGRSCGVVVPLHRARPSRFGARVSVPEGGPAELTVIVNGRPLARWSVTGAFTDYEAFVPAAALQPGRNLLRLRVETGPKPAVAALWLEPSE
jgi:hypothetical protein